jgi:hypothetical protein
MLGRHLKRFLQRYTVVSLLFLILLFCQTSLRNIASLSDLDSTIAFEKDDIHFQLCISASLPFITLGDTIDQASTRISCHCLTYIPTITSS